ncbi:MAG: GNAT family N-acetyltransferase [Phycisphaerales bacterium]|nr:GNAT family N-acetyltransferase [Phycisphaerales bacterium]
MTKLTVLDTTIAYYSRNENDYICLTDMARYRDAERTNYIIQNWMRNRSTIEFLGLWEQLNNPDFKGIEFDAFRNQAGLNSFTLTPKLWIEKTAAVGLISKAGRYGGTYAHKDIAFEFASWLSVEFKLYLIKEFQRLKETEAAQLGWDIKRNLVKINYRIHTDAVKRHLIPAAVTEAQAAFVYASEADLLNMALFGITTAEWRRTNPDKDGNLRDYADVAQLVCLSNLENLNALFIKEGLPQSERLIRLNVIAIHQMTLLSVDPVVKKLEREEGDKRPLSGSPHKEKPAITIRPLDLAEMAVSAEILRESFGTVAAEFGLTPQNAPTNPAFSRKENLEADDADGCRCYGLFIGDDQVGFMELRPKDATCHELRKLGVRPSFRHAGYGRRLLDYAKEQVAKSGGRAIVIGIIEENLVLKDWYMANGFVHTGTKIFPHLPFTVGYMEFQV